MSLAPTLMDYLDQHHAQFRVIEHPHTDTSRDTVRTAQVAPQRLAKSVLLTDGSCYLMAVLPADRRVSIDALSEHLERDYQIATEDEVAYLFYDCEPGSIPPFGQPYGLQTVVDYSLLEQPDIYFEAGDHCQLVQIDGEQFLTLLGQTPRGAFSTYPM